ncbi:adhesion G protein-coupled receptor F5 [Pangasianodon hypophthalmus]|uniref:adhesion G protein-coupled receptor F5 n=1 Tax=Pangasianodon hypophthalmus TaxID=310915 RepID=UPI000EFE8AB8|nr:adhesion G protein-coupled receptor F5 [Pangasianodon hypophthalmus]XP_053098380.1 adhesion G protein-coupled receptor F5 [Pangasianodon hypophthalmus]
MATTEKTSNYLLTFTAILLMKTCVVETQGFLETSAYTAELNSKDGQLNHSRQKRETSPYAVQYIVVVEVNVSEVILIQQLKSLFNLQIDNSTKISSVEITTVCQLNDTGYQCRCEDQYFWPCDKCMEYGPCNNGTANSSCYCINGVPSDGQFCQPISNISNGTCPTPPPATETPKNMSLTIDEKFDIALTNQNSAKYNKYKTTLENLINSSYRNMAGYKPGSVRILRFRPGSINVDFTITTTTNELDFRSANSELSQVLTANGFKVAENAFAYSVEYDLVQSTGKIYPLQDVQLNCTLPTGVMGNIQWRVDGVDPFLNSVKYNILNNNRTLKVISVSAVDSGVYECITENNSLRFIQWQRIVIQPYPSIQVDPDKVFKCDDLSIPLQCCAYSSYTIEWTKDSLSPLTPPGPGSGCITYNFAVQKQDCEAGEKQVIFTCRLSENSLSVLSYSSKNISITITKKAFYCSDSSFGVGTVNQTAFRQCEGDETGIKWAVCNKTGQWSIISNNCTLRVIQNLADKAEYLDVEEVPLFAANLSNTAEENSENITTVPVNLLKVVDLLSRLANISKTQSFTVDKNTMEDFLKTVAVITSEKAQETWKSFNDDNTNQNASTVLLQSIQSIGSSLSNENFSISTSNIQLIRNLNTLIHEMFSPNSTTQIGFPDTSRSFPVTVIIFSELNSVLPVRSATYSDGSETHTSINGDVAVIEGESRVNNVSLFFDVKNKSLGNPQCVFWNFNLLNGTGAWDSAGCELKPLSNQTKRLTCECNHTTSFSILMSPVIPDNETLAYITYIGVCISMGSLVLCLIFESLIWKSMSKTDTSYMRHVSIVNIALSLLVADICFIIGAAIGKKGQKTPVGPCSTVTFFIHFFYLALFFWMLLSALLLLYRTVVVFSRMSRTVMMTIAFTVGYGAPLIIAIVTIAATSGNGGYIQEDNTCWLNWYKTKAILAFVIPALAIVAINLLVLIIIVCKILRSGTGATIQRDEKHAIVMIARCVSILTPLFGLTWGFGIGTMVSSAFGIHLVFAILNSLQGFFILVLGTLMDNKIFGVLLGRWKQKNISSNRTGSIIEGSSPSKVRGFYHIFPRRYVYHVSTAAYSSHVPSSNTETFKFTEK